MSNITNINEQRYDEMPGVSHVENQLLADRYSEDELSIKSKFDRIIEAVQSGDVYNSKVKTSDSKNEE